MDGGMAPCLPRLPCILFALSELWYGRVYVISERLLTLRPRTAASVQDEIKQNIFSIAIQSGKRNQLLSDPFRDFASPYLTHLCSLHFLHATCYYTSLIGPYRSRTAMHHLPLLHIYLGANRKQIELPVIDEASQAVRRCMHAQLSTALLLGTSAVIYPQEKTCEIVPKKLIKASYLPYNRIFVINSLSSIALSTLSNSNNAQSN